MNNEPSHEASQPAIPSGESNVPGSVANHSLSNSARQTTRHGKQPFYAAFRNPFFVICLVLLACFTIGLETMVREMGINRVKQAVPIKAKLDTLDKTKLKPYLFVKSIPLQSDMVQQLGTEEYIQWLIDDPLDEDGRLVRTPDTPAWTAPTNGRMLSLFVTYYTGTRDQVPHVPEVCYAGSGHILTRQSYDSVTIKTAQGDREVPIQVLEFERESIFGDSKRLVIYTFHANGDFRKDRNAVRVAVSNPTSTHAYFSKLELGVDIGRGYPTKEKALTAGKRFLQVVIPILLSDHWPDWNQVTATGQPGQELISKDRSTQVPGVPE